MEKQVKALASKKPPRASKNHTLIEDWLRQRVMPGLKPLVMELDRLILDTFSDLNYAIKWGKAYYGIDAHGWLFEIAAYDVSVNLVFLNGAALNPQPPLGNGPDTRYFKLRASEEIRELDLARYLKQAGQLPGWQ